MLWLVLYLSHHPDVQQRLIKEIESVIGYSRAPSLTDRLQYENDKYFSEDHKHVNVSFKCEIFAQDAIY